MNVFLFLNDIKKPELTEYDWVVGGGRSLQFYFDEPFDIYLDETFITKEQLEATKEYLNVVNKPETIHEKRQRLIIQHLKEMGIYPLNFNFKNGMRTPKSDLKAKLVNLHPKLFTESTFDKA